MQLRQPIKGYNGLKKHSTLCRKRVSLGLSFTKTSWTMEADTTQTCVNKHTQQTYTHSQLTWVVFQNNTPFIILFDF